MIGLIELYYLEMLDLYEKNNQKLWVRFDYNNRTWRNIIQHSRVHINKFMNPSLQAQIKVNFKVTTKTVVDFCFPRKIDGHFLVEEIPIFRHLVIFTDFTGAWKCALNTFNNITWDSNKV